MVDTSSFPSLSSEVSLNLQALELPVALAAILRRTIVMLYMFRSTTPYITYAGAYRHVALVLPDSERSSPVSTLPGDLFSDMEFARCIHVI